MGFAFGLKSEAFGLDKHFVDLVSFPNRFYRVLRYPGKRDEFEEARGVAGDLAIPFF